MALNMSLSYSKVVLSLFSHSTNIWVCFGFVHFVLDKQQRTNFTIQRRERKLRKNEVCVGDRWGCWWTWERSHR